jgi:hypothetical protein
VPGAKEWALLSTAERQRILSTLTNDKLAQSLASKLTEGLHLHNINNSKNCQDWNVI